MTSPAPRRSLAVLFAVALSVCLPRLAVARAAAAPTEAQLNAVGKAHFKKGLNNYRQARYREAITEFEAAYKARPHGVLYFNIAQCYEKLGDIPSALRSFHEYLRKVPNADDRATVAQAMKNLEARLAEKGLQQILVYSDPSGATVTVDGTVTGRSPFTTEMPPGTHSLRIEHEGYAPKAREFVLKADTSLEIDETLELALSAPPAPPVVETTPEPQQPPAPDPGQVSPTQSAATSGLSATNGTTSARPHFGVWKYVAAGGGVACAVVAILAGATAKSASAELLSKQHDPPVPTQLRDQAVNNSHASNFFAVASVGLIATGGTLFIVEGHF